MNVCACDHEGHAGTGRAFCRSALLVIVWLTLQKNRLGAGNLEKEQDALDLGQVVPGRSFWVRESRRNRRTPKTVVHALVGGSRQRPLPARMQAVPISGHRIGVQGGGAC